MSKSGSAFDFIKRSQPIGARELSNEAHWAPNTDVYLTENGVIIKVELAGMRREDLELTVDGNHLRISGHRSDGCRTGKCNFIVMEINYGPFETILELPPGYDLSRARASYQNGFLKVEVPEQTGAAVRNVPIEITEEI